MSVSISRFLTWKETARPGDRYEYHRGFLAEQCAQLFASDPEMRVRGEAVAAYLSGDYELAQVRVGPASFSYLIIRRRVRDTGFRFWYRNGFVERASPR